ncbi:MAG: molybdopterin molybdotransferase MoeA [Halobacteriales archaeon]|nr:molybdopterin molybdotransferase MoeA [Halobacteriales archaeon]
MGAHAGKMRPFRALIGYEQALALVLAKAQPVRRVERVPLEQAGSRVLAQEVRAPVPVPPFARAAMDGFAVKAHESFGASKANPRALRIVGTLHAGDAPGRAVQGGECIQIATGAKVPEGADAVVRVEDALVHGDTVKVEVAVPPGRNISGAGIDIPQGSVVLRAGQRLAPAHVGVLASLGLTHADVFARPKVAVLPTGSEIQAAGKPLREGQIWDSNTHTLTALVREAGGEPVTWGAVPDTLEALEAALDKAQEADLVVLSGGSSVGERDLLVDALGKRGTLLFHGVQIRPGKPMLAADLQGKLALGFPGYPVSCLTNGYLFLLPVLAKMQGQALPAPRIVRGVMGERLSSALGRLQILPVRVQDGKVFSTYKESGALTSMAESTGYILIPENTDLVDEGQEVEVVLW